MAVGDAIVMASVGRIGIAPLRFATKPTTAVGRRTYPEGKEDSNVQRWPPNGRVRNERGARHLRVAPLVGVVGTAWLAVRLAHRVASTSVEAREDEAR